MLTSYLDLRPPQVSFTFCIMGNYVFVLSSANLFKNQFCREKTLVKKNSSFVEARECINVMGLVRLSNILRGAKV